MRNDEFGILSFTLILRGLNILCNQDQIADLFEYVGEITGCTVVWWLEGSRFNSQLGPFCVEFACSPGVCVGSLRVLRLVSFVSVWPCDGLGCTPPLARWL